MRVKRIGWHDLPLPKYETNGASGFDLRANLIGNFETMGSRLSISNGEVLKIPCGFAFEVPAGHEMQVRPRSGLSSHGVMVALGTVDADYRGEVSIVVLNASGGDWLLEQGDRIAQGVIAPVVRAELVEAEELSETARGGNGFGSTGSI